MVQVSLSVLIEMMLQKIYHELTILAELLPRKTDMERKIEIFNFSSRTRMLFVRLLALVKWASSAGKVEKCSNIVMFLGKQSNMFMETANQLAIMARETCQSHAAQLLGNLGIYSKTSQLSNGEDNSEVFNGRDNSEVSYGPDNR